MDGENDSHLVIYRLLIPFHLDGKESVEVDGVREALGTFCWRQQANSVFDLTIEILHRMANEKSKSRR